jgi:hypothetical protein
MQIWVIRLLVLLSLSSPVYARGEDVLGWQNTRWGMTEEQAVAALGTQGLRVNPPLKYAGLYVPLRSTIQISGYKMNALLQFSDETKTLRQVLLTWRTDSIVLWEKLGDLLTEKYGPPAQVGKLIEWRFKTTIIDLDRWAEPEIDGRVTVRFYPASDDKDGKNWR